MRRRVAGLALLTALCLVLPAGGGILRDSYKPVNRVTINGHLLPIDTRFKSAETYINAPYVQNASKEYLAYDLEGTSPRVFFQKEKGVNTVWAITIVSKFEEKQPTESFRGYDFDVRRSGFVMTLAAGDGKLQGHALTWTHDEGLMLTADPRKAGKVRVELGDDWYEQPPRRR